MEVSKLLTCFSIAVGVLSRSADDQINSEPPVVTFTCARQSESSLRHWHRKPNISAWFGRQPTDLEPVCPRAERNR